MQLVRDPDAVDDSLSPLGRGGSSRPEVSTRKAAQPAVPCESSPHLTLLSAAPTAGRIL